jgi:hypothetical protein
VSPADGSIQSLPLRGNGFGFRGRELDIEVTLEKEYQLVEVRAALTTPLFGLEPSQYNTIDRLSTLLNNTPDKPTVYKRRVLMPDAPGLYYWQIATSQSGVYSTSPIYTMTVIDMPVTTVPSIKPTSQTTISPNSAPPTKAVSGSQATTSTKPITATPNPNFMSPDEIEIVILFVLMRRYPTAENVFRNTTCSVKTGGKFKCQWDFRDAEFSYSLLATGMSTSKELVVGFAGTRGRDRCVRSCKTPVKFSVTQPW